MAVKPRYPSLLTMTNFYRQCKGLQCLVTILCDGTLPSVMAIYLVYTQRVGSSKLSARTIEIRGLEHLQRRVRHIFLGIRRADIKNELRRVT